MPTSYPFTANLRVLCERGVLEHRFVAGAADEVDAAVSSVLDDPPGRRRGAPFSEPADPWGAQIEHFLDCVSGGAEPRDGSFAQARAALAVALAARAAAESGEAQNIGHWRRRDRPGRRGDTASVVDFPRSMRGKLDNRWRRWRVGALARRANPAAAHPAAVPAVGTPTHAGTRQLPHHVGAQPARARAGDPRRRSPPMLTRINRRRRPRRTISSSAASRPRRGARSPPRTRRRARPTRPGRRPARRRPPPRRGRTPAASSSRCVAPARSRHHPVQARADDVAGVDQPARHARPARGQGSGFASGSSTSSAFLVDLQSPPLIGPQGGGTIQRARVHPYAPDQAPRRAGWRSRAGACRCRGR